MSNSKIEWLLGLVAERFFDDPQSIEAKEFVKEFRMKWNVGKHHETRVKVDLGVEFHRGGSYHRVICIDQDMLKILDEVNERVYLGEVNGKHSEVSVNWDDLVEDISFDYFEVETCREDAGPLEYFEEEIEENETKYQKLLNEVWKEKVAEDSAFDACPSFRDCLSAKLPRELFRKLSKESVAKYVMKQYASYNGMDSLNEDSGEKGEEPAAKKVKT